MRLLASFIADSDSVNNYCVLCTNERHPLYLCNKFKSLLHDDRILVLKKHNLCLNCLGSRHSAKSCKSSHRCKKCQRSHHTLIHKESRNDAVPRPTSSADSSASSSQVTSNTAVKLRSSSLLMTCRVLVAAPNGSAMEVRALLDNASSASLFLSV